MHLLNTARVLMALIAMSIATSAFALELVELAKLTSSNTSVNLRFGAGVSVSGNTIVVGNEGALNAGGAETGSISVFTRDQGNITLEAELFPSDGISGYWFGRSVVIDGDTILVGVENADEYNGAVYVYTRTNGVWAEQAKLSVSSAGTTTSFGHAVDLDGDTAIISAAPFDPQLGSEITAYVFVRNNGIWTEQQQIILPERTSASFGSDVAVSGDTILLSGADAFYVYIRQGGAWTVQEHITGDSSLFGLSLDLEADTAVAGDLGIRGQGSVYVFERDQGTWTFTSRLQASDGFSNDLFSYRLELSGDVIVAGAQNQTQNGDRAGAAYVFQRENGTWSEAATLLASDGDSRDRFGSAVAIHGNTIVVAAEQSAYVFAIQRPSVDFSVTPDTLDFGAVLLGQSSQQSLAVQNLSTETITVSASAALPFSVSTGGEIQIGPGETALADVQFAPTSIGPATGTLTLATTQQSIGISLSAEGVAPAQPVIDVSSTTLNFPDTVIGTLSQPIEIIVTNVGDAALTVAAVDMFGDSADFAVGTIDCTDAIVPPGASCALSFAFSPASSGNRIAQAAVVSNAANGDQSINLFGTGIALLPVASIDPLAHDFGSIHLDEVSDPVTITVTNSGGSDLVIGSAMLTGDDFEQFDIQDNACAGLTLSLNQFCNISITFQPTTVIGFASASLTLVTNDPAGAPIVNLFGIGVTEPGIDEGGSSPGALAPGRNDMRPQLGPEKKDFFLDFSSETDFRVLLPKTIIERSVGPDSGTYVITLENNWDAWYYVTNTAAGSVAGSAPGTFILPPGEKRSFSLTFSRGDRISFVANAGFKYPAQDRQDRLMLNMFALDLLWRLIEGSDPPYNAIEALTDVISIGGELALGPMFDLGVSIGTGDLLAIPGDVADVLSDPESVELLVMLGFREQKLAKWAGNVSTVAYGVRVFSILKFLINEIIAGTTRPFGDLTFEAR